MSRTPTLALLSLLALGGCASTPPLETFVTGALPAGRSYVPVGASKHYGSADLPTGALRACLGKLGVSEGKGADDLLLQVSATLRPARSRLIVGEETAGKVRRRPDRPSEELVLALSDAKSGVLGYKAVARRVLAKGATSAPADTVLADALCAAMASAPPAVAAR